MLIRLGLPIPGGALATAARDMGAAVLVSANAFTRRRKRRGERRGGPPPEFLGFYRPSSSLHGLDVALDSAGFVAHARYGGYEWTPEMYVRGLVASLAPGRLAWWAAMDSCCEPEVAHDRTTVRFRMAETCRMLGECRRVAAGAGLPEPLPVVQGWTADDYERCVYSMPLHTWPELVGVGSVCRRRALGPAGLLRVVERLDRVLPPHVRLHLFGVKGDALPTLLRDPSIGDRVASMDSCAWDRTVREDCRAGGEPFTMERRAAGMVAWYERQRGHVAPQADAQPSLRLTEALPPDESSAELAEWLYLVEAGEIEGDSGVIHFAREYGHALPRQD